MKSKFWIRYICSFAIGVLVLTSVWLINDYKIVRSENYPANSFWSIVALMLTLVPLSGLVFFLVPQKTRSSKLIATGVVLVLSTAVSAILLICFGQTLHTLLPQLTG